MKKDKKNKAQKKMDDGNWIKMTNNVTSANDYTGLVPSPPTSESESESYSQIESIPTQTPEFVDELPEKKPRNLRPINKT
jgi:hypothetical protein